MSSQPTGWSRVLPGNLEVRKLQSNLTVGHMESMPLASADFDRKGPST